MKKVFIILSVLVGLSTMTFAQEKTGKRMGKKKSFDREWKKDRSPEDRANARTEHLDKMVNLNEAQKEQVYKLYLESTEKTKERKEVTRKDREEMRQHFNTHQEAMNEILTAEQQALLKEKRVAARKENQSRGKRNFEGKGKHSKPAKASDDDVKG